MSTCIASLYSYNSGIKAKQLMNIISLYGMPLLLVMTENNEEREN